MTWAVFKISDLPFEFSLDPLRLTFGGNATTFHLNALSAPICAVYVNEECFRTV
jgi:hypothetical protein